MKQIKRILAIAGVVLILGMYVVTFLSAIFVKEVTGRLFLTSVVVTMLVPALMYVVQMIYRIFYKKAPEGSPGQKNQKGFAEAAEVNRKQTGERKEAE